MQDCEMLEKKGSPKGKVSIHKTNNLPDLELLNLKSICPCQGHNQKKYCGGLNFRGVFH